MSQEDEEKETKDTGYGEWDRTAFENSASGSQAWMNLKREGRGHKGKAGAARIKSSSNPCKSSHCAFLWN